MRHLAASLVSLLFVVSSAGGGEYRDSSGYTLTYPDGWFAVTREVLQQGEGAFPPELRKWLRDNKVDLSRMTVMVLREGNEEFLENVNIVLHPQQMPMEQESVTQATTMLPQQFRAAGAKIENIQGRLQKLGDREAVIVEYDVELPGVPVELRQRQAYVPGGGKTFIITFTGTRTSFPKYAAAFDDMLNKFQAPAPLSRGMNFDWNRVLVSGFIGAGIAVVAAIFSRFFARKKQA